MLRQQYPAQRFKGKGQLKWEKGAEKHIFVPHYAQLCFGSLYEHHETWLIKEKKYSKPPVIRKCGLITR